VIWGKTGRRNILVDFIKSGRQIMLEERRNPFSFGDGFRRGYGGMSDRIGRRDGGGGF